MAGLSLFRALQLLLVVFTTITIAVPTPIIVRINDEPNPDDPAVQEHLRKQAELIDTERHQGQDWEFRATLSPIAQQAEEIVAAIRQYEIDHFWRKAGSYGLEENERFAGMMFAKAKPLIPSTKLWDIVSRMPKGSLLHAHPSALLGFERVFNIILETEGMVITSSQDVSTKVSAQNASISFLHVNNITAVAEQVKASIHSPEYVPGTLVPVTLAADAFPGGREGFINFLMSKVTVSPEESTRHDLGVDAIWRDFQKCFDPAGSALNYEPVIRKFYQYLFEGFVDDGISWAEFRSGGSAKLVPEGQETADPDLDFWIRVMLDELEKFQQTEKGSKFWGIKLIWSDARSLDRPTVIDHMKKAIERKQHFPDIFGGYDLVAQEDLGRPLSDLAPELIWFQEETAALNLTMPFFFHAGETLGDGNSTDDNLFDAVLFDTRRIGHGFSLYKHPLLMDMINEKKIMIEVCPISNEVLRLNTDIMHHPMPAMVSHGVAVAISNDDPAILGQDGPGLSYDFYETIQGFDNVGLGGLGAFAHNSIRWSNFEDQNQADWVRDIELGATGAGIKAKRLQEWQSQWEAYCQWIVDEYSDWNSTIVTP
ncbi:hypothetical protein F5X96DRAFT_674555 [Biscogniauxia mediterranea]|nr:hypothetical protein F5X96DRAFT_674555 [Biscogniauxia mediterranea]